MTDATNIFAPPELAIELPAEVRDEIETAKDFAEAAAEIFEITQQAAEAARLELAEARAKVDQADDAHARSGRAVDLANREFVAKLRAAGLVRTADGIRRAADIPDALQAASEVADRDAHESASL